MTPDPKLPPLREALERIAWRETPIHPRGPDDFTVYLPRHLVLGVGAPHDALIRQQEARIAEQALRIEVLQNSARERDAVVEDLEARIAELEAERETFRTAFSVANDQAEHTSSLFLPVEAEKDRLAMKVAELEAELAEFRELAREAHEMNRRSTIGVYEVTRVFHSLAVLHKEE